jgi:LmbE family N-acetylglucosaminyl deacetylase
MTVLAVSPHFDDAAFSAGGVLATLARRYPVGVVTVFTQSVLNPSGFALRCQTDKGLAPDADYMGIRGMEERDALDALDAWDVWMNLPEAPHRGYDSPEALFSGILPSDEEMGREVLQRLRQIGAREEPCLVLTCQGLGRHVDHLHVVRAVAAWAEEERVPVLWWRDLPYAIREPGAAPSPDIPGGLQPVSFALDADAVQAKLDACAAYKTQLPYQFGRDADAPPEHAMRERLSAHMKAEGGGRAPAESFAASPLLLEMLPPVLSERVVQRP